MEILDGGGAAADAGRSIDLLERQRARLGDQWPPRSAVTLASCYVLRGAAQSLASSRARPSTIRPAADILAGLRERLADQWTPGLAVELANAYVSCGQALGFAHDLAGALRSIGQGIEIMERLRERLADQWTPGWARA